LHEPDRQLPGYDPNRLWSLFYTNHAYYSFLFRQREVSFFTSFLTTGPSLQSNPFHSIPWLFTCLTHIKLTRYIQLAISLLFFFLPFNPPPPSHPQHLVHFFNFLSHLISLYKVYLYPRFLHMYVMCNHRWSTTSIIFARF